MVYTLAFFSYFEKKNSISSIFQISFFDSRESEKNILLWIWYYARANSFLYTDGITSRVNNLHMVRILSTKILN